MDSLYIISLKLLQTIDSLACHVECALYLYMNVIFCIMPFGLFFTIAHYKKTKKEKNVCLKQVIIGSYYCQRSELLG